MDRVNTGERGIERKLPTRRKGLGPVVSFSFASARPIRQSKREIAQTLATIHTNRYSRYSDLSLNVRSSGFLLPSCKPKKLDPSKGYKLKLLLLNNAQLPADFPFFFFEFVAKRKKKLS